MDYLMYGQILKIKVAFNAVNFPDTTNQNNLCSRTLSRDFNHTRDRRVHCARCTALCATAWTSHWPDGGFSVTVPAGIYIPVVKDVIQFFFAQKVVSLSCSRTCNV